MEHYLEPARTAGGTLVKPWWNPRGTFPGPRRTLEEIGGTLVPSSGARRAGGSLVETWWKPGGTLVEPYLKPPRTTLQPSQNLVKPWQNSGGNLVEPSVEPKWNLTSNHPGPPCSPGGTLVEPYLKPPRPPRLVEPWRNPRETYPQPSKKLVEPWWNPRGTLPQTTQTTPPGGTLAEPS